MHARHALQFGVQASPIDTPYVAWRAYWQEAERLGYDWASVGIHFMPQPVFGARATDPWNEAWTTVAALAEATAWYPHWRACHQRRLPSPGAAG